MNFDHFLMGPEESLWSFLEGHKLADRLSVLGDNNLLAGRLNFIHKLQALSLELRCLDGFLLHDEMLNMTMVITIVILSCSVNGRLVKKLQPIELPRNDTDLQV